MLRRFFRAAFASSKSSTSESGKMLEPRMRYLKNEQPDYITGEQITVPTDKIKSQIFKYIEDIKANVKPIERNGRDGIYLGTAGIAYMFYHLSGVAALENHRNEFLEDAIEYIQPALKVCAAEVNSTDIPAFMLGNCGVYAVASVIYHAVGNVTESLKFKELFNEASGICKDMHFLHAGSDELFVGRAGYICGALWMSQQTGLPFKTEEIFGICEVMMTSGRDYSRAMESAPPLMYSYYNVEYVGAGHGICSILQMLMSVPGYLVAHPEDARDVQCTADYVRQLQDRDGNFPATTTEDRNERNDLVHWCHGAGGVVYFLVKSYLLWQEPKYLDAARKVADLIWSKGLLKKGPGLCHGVAGNGYVFLLMYRLTEEKMYLHRALQFAVFLEQPAFIHSARVPDNPFSLFEGTAGTVCFLADLLQPKKASFPFCDVFNQ